MTLLPPALLELEHFRTVEMVSGEAAFQALAESVEADPDVHVGEVDAFEFLHGLKEEYRKLGDIQDGRA